MVNIPKIFKPIFLSGGLGLAALAGATEQDALKIPVKAEPRIADSIDPETGVQFDDQGDPIDPKLEVERLNNEQARLDDSRTNKHWTALYYALAGLGTGTAALLPSKNKKAELQAALGRLFAGGATKNDLFALLPYAVYAEDISQNLQIDDNKDLTPYTRVIKLILKFPKEFSKDELPLVLTGRKSDDGVKEILFGVSELSEDNVPVSSRDLGRIIASSTGLDPGQKDLLENLFKQAKLQSIASGLNDIGSEDSDDEMEIPHQSEEKFVAQGSTASSYDSDEIGVPPLESNEPNSDAEMPIAEAEPQSSEKYTYQMTQFKENSPFFSKDTAIYALENTLKKEVAINDLVKNSRNAQQFFINLFKTLKEKNILDFVLPAGSKGELSLNSFKKDFGKYKVIKISKSINETDAFIHVVAFTLHHLLVAFANPSK